MCLLQIYSTEHSNLYIISSHFGVSLITIDSEYSYVEFRGIAEEQVILIVTVLYLMVTVRLYTEEISTAMSTMQKLISLTKSQSELYETRKNVLNTV